MAATKKLYGKAPLTLVRTTDERMVYVYRGQPAPSNLTAEERKRLLKGDFLEERDVETEASADAKPAYDGKVDAITAYVGDDKAKAKEYLDAETAKPTDQQRSSLVSKLQAVVGE